MFIPLHQLITWEMSKEVGVGKIMSDCSLEMISPKHCFLAVFLLRERKNPSSVWKPYIDMLPRDTSSFPIFFTDEEMKWLDGSPFAGNTFYDLIYTYLQCRGSQE